MKKKLCLILATIMAACSMGLVSAHAKVGDVIGTALHTDIVAYVNHYAIPSYAVNGTSVIVAEDLRNFGFDVIWNGNDRTLSVSRNNSTSVSQMDFTKNGKTGDKFTDILETDIKVYVEGKLVTSYAMNGFTMIPVEELTMLGQVAWVAEERALKLWVDGLNVRTDKQAIFINVPSDNSAFANLKNKIIAQGEYYAKTNEYAIIIDEIEELYLILDYDIEDDSITFSMMYNKINELVSLIQIDNDEGVIWSGISYTIDGKEYSIIYDYSDGEWIINTNTFPDELLDETNEILGASIELFDAVLSEYFNMSVVRFGIY